LLAIVGLLGVGEAFGQQAAPYVGQDPSLYEQQEGKEERERKWSWFLRAKKDTPVEQLAFANRLREEGSRGAGKQYQALLKFWPDSPEAPAAQLAYAEWLEERGEHRVAFDEYQYLMELYGGRFPNYQRILARQMRIAKHIMESRKGGFLFYDGFSAPERAVPLFRKILKNGPHWEGAPEAQYLIGRAHQLNQRYEEAVVAYTRGLQRYPYSAFAEKCAYGRATCLFELAEENRYSVQALEEARSAAVLFLKKFPGSEHAEVVAEYERSLQRRQAKGEYDKAVFYDRIAHKPEAALLAYKEFIRRYPNSEWTGVAEIRIDALRRMVGADDDS